MPATGPPDRGVSDDETLAGDRAAPGSPGLAASASSEDRQLHPGSGPTGEAASLGEPAAAIQRGLRWNLVGRPAIEILNLVGVAVLARLVAPADFGRFAIALIVLVLSSVPTQAVQYTIVQRKELDQDHLRTGVTLTILLGVAMCALCLAASYTVVPRLFDARTALLVRLMIPACLINSVNTVQHATITRRLEFRRLSLLDMTIALVGVATSIGLAAAGLEGEAMVIGVVAGSVAGFILICCWTRPPIPSFCVRSARDLLRSGVPAASNAASVVCFQNCDYVIIGARVGPLQAGYYFRAYTLGVVYQTKVSQVMTALGLPVLSRVASEEDVRRLRERMVQTTTLILFPLLTLLAIVAPGFVTWFYGPAWGAVVVPVQILTIGGAAMLVAQAVTVTMLATGRARAVMWWGWAHFLVYGGLVFAVARSGLPAVAAAAVVAHTTFMVISYLMLARGAVRSAFQTLAKDLLPATVGSIGVAVLALPIYVLGAALGLPFLPCLLGAAIAGGAGYHLSLRLCFPIHLRHLALLTRRVLPPGAQRVLGRLMLRPARDGVRLSA